MFTGLAYAAAQAHRVAQGGGNRNFIIQAVSFVFIIAFALLMLKMQKKFQRHQVEIETPLPSSEIRKRILHKLTPHGFIMASQTDDSFTFVKESKPSCTVGFVLILFCVIPAIIYAIIGGSKQPLVLTITDETTKRTVTISGPYWWVWVAKKAVV